METPNRIADTVFIFLDDIRQPPSDDSWVVVRTTPEAYETIRRLTKMGVDMVVSLDHDLGQDEHGNNLDSGYDLLNWLEKDIATDDQFRPSIAFKIHSANPVGRQNMDRAIGAIYRRLGCSN